MLEIAFRYRRGGGAVEAAAIERGLKPPQAPSPLDLSLASGAARVDAVSLRSAGTTLAPALIARERFCALAQDGVTIVAAAPDETQGFDPVALATMDGAKALIAEACP
jgi:hypothetical protein